MTWVWGCVDFERRLRGRTPLSSRGDCGVWRGVVYGDGELSVYLKFYYEISRILHLVVVILKCYSMFYLDFVCDFYEC